MKQDNDLLYRVALTRVPLIGDVHARILAMHYEKAEDIFRAPARELEKIEGVGQARARSIRTFGSLADCEREIRFMEKFGITALYVRDQNYPQRLLHCYDSPVLLYYKGKADLNTARIISVVGTRNNSPYGKKACEQMIEGLKGTGILVISGLAFGIDTIAHKTALRCGLPTVAILAHGLDRIYPGQNRGLAASMTEDGGLLTDFGHGNAPDKQNFPRRNRITAGMCDALVVVESGTKGGSLITADIANSYQREVLAFPGRIDDPRSMGCNLLIRQNKAVLVSSATDLMETMNWIEKEKPRPGLQKSLFMELSAKEQEIVTWLEQKGPAHLDVLASRSGLNPGSLSGVLLNLELQGLVTAMPGRMYKLL